MSWTTGWVVTNMKYEELPLGESLGHSGMKNPGTIIDFKNDDDSDEKILKWAESLGMKNPQKGVSAQHMYFNIYNDQRSQHVYGSWRCYAKHTETYEVWRMK